MTTFIPPRYLSSFHPKKHSHCFVDVLVIGGGIAGLRACLAIDPSLTTVLLTKDKVEQSNSRFAQGGIAGVLDPSDSFKNHIADTLTAGGTLCDTEVVDEVIRLAPEEIEGLIKLGTEFDKDNDKIRLGREGGHSHNRIAHAHGDATGEEIIRAMIAKVHAADNIRVWENTFTLDLLTVDGECRGVVVSSEQYGTQLVWAKQTILCTGGAGKLYRESTNPDVATADGHAMAYRAGAKMADMEFIQFHPTVLYIAGSSRSLISEALRGEGAILVDKHGERFMADYDERLELAPRDVVSQATVSHMEKTRHPCVYLSMKHLDPKFVHERFPGISAACMKFDINIATDRIPVRPGAHYIIGGVHVDHEGQTSVPKLWAAGEVTCSGLHGANRLASNSLLEGLVYGKKTGEGASKAALAIKDRFESALISYPVCTEDFEPLDLADIRNSLQSLMWRAAGVRRTGERLTDALEMIHSWEHYVLQRQFRNQEGWELQNMLTVSKLVIEMALKREESRGVHFRLDFPKTDEKNWLKHQFVVKEM